MNFNSRRWILLSLSDCDTRYELHTKQSLLHCPRTDWKPAQLVEHCSQALPGSQHSGIVRKQQVFSSSESVLAIGGMLQMSMHLWSILSEREAYDMLSFIPICCTIMYVFFQLINALQEPTPNWTNLRRNVRNVSKMSEMSKKFDNSEMG